MQCCTVINVCTTNTINKRDQETIAILLVSVHSHTTEDLVQLRTRFAWDCNILLVQVCFHAKAHFSFSPQTVKVDDRPPESWSGQGFLPLGSFSWPMLLHAHSERISRLLFDCEKHFKTPLDVI